MSLTDKYRPNKFDEVCGQKDSIEILQNILSRKDKPHTYLFSGTYGIGKTTLARIFLNKLGGSGIDIVEINSANNRGIDTARNIIETCDFFPMFGDIRGYILDECQKFTLDYQNAMLKILEEPPRHVYFVLCTTDPGKLIKTIRSRCTELELQLIPKLSIVKYLRNICEEENKNVSIKVIKQIAITSEGHIRDAIKLLEKIFDIDNEERAWKIASHKLDEESEIIELCRALLKNNNWNEVREILKGLKEEPEKIRYTVLGYMNSVLLNATNIEKGKKAALVIEYFIEPFYNSGKAGLTSACFNIYV